MDGGGADAARSILQQTVGDERADAILSNIDDRQSQGLYTLRNSEAKQLAHVLSK